MPRHHEPALIDAWPWKALELEPDSREAVTATGHATEYAHVIGRAVCNLGGGCWERVPL